MGFLSGSLKLSIQVLEVGVGLLIGSSQKIEDFSGQNQKYIKGCVNEN